MRTILRLLIAFILTGMGSMWAPIDAEGRTRAMLSEESQIVLSNIHVFDVAGGVLKEAQDILIEGTQIKAVGRIDASDKDVGKIDLSGKFAFPGLFDCHTHLAFLTTKKEDEMIRDLRSFVANGITQVRDVGGPINILSQMNKRISCGELLGPKLFFSGPMLERAPLFYKSKNKILPGFSVSINTREDVDRVLSELARNGACMVKTYNKMDLDVYKHLLAVAKKHGLRVVHDPGRYLFHEIPMDMAIDLGVTSIEHGVAAWPVVLKDELKKQHDQLMAENADQAARESFMDKVIELGVESISTDKLQHLIHKMLENDIYICPTLVIYGYEDIFTREFIRHKVKILVGHDGCSPTKLFSEMKMLKDLGLSESEIIKGATIYPAQWLGVEDRFGSISPGMQANLVILDKNPLENIDNFESTFMVLMNGQVVFHKVKMEEK
ncbi:MAG: amidohydrolase family protein [Candidatus Aminicenantes bacterium]|nr:amidohydrolase family protein [Candidatus Aminicenantes bacterium]